MRVWSVIGMSRTDEPERGVGEFRHGAKPLKEDLGTVCKTNANAWQIRFTRAPLKFVYDYSRIPLLVLSVN